MRGGTIRSAMQLQLLDHPARFISWIEGANVVRQVNEYLTETDVENITHPYLLQTWEASDDLLTWTLNLRQGIKFNNGDELTADDVIFTFDEWLNPDIGSSMLGLLTYLDGPEDVEKVDDYTVRMHLNAPNIAVPEHLFHYPAAILHRNFEGDFVKQPIGTGAFFFKRSPKASGRSSCAVKITGEWVRMVNRFPISTRFFMFRSIKTLRLLPCSLDRWTRCTSHAPAIGRR